MPAGRPSTYNDKIADILCERISKGEALYKMCAEDGMPSYDTVYNWLAKHPEFVDKYTRAREMQQDYEADLIIQIADTATDANIARLQIDARKWRASKLAPKKYGDKVGVDHAGKVTFEVKIES